MFVEVQVFLQEHAGQVRAAVPAAGRRWAGVVRLLQAPPSAVAAPRSARPALSCPWASPSPVSRAAPASFVSQLIHSHWEAFSSAREMLCTPRCRPLVRSKPGPPSWFIIRFITRYTS